MTNTPKPNQAIITSRYWFVLSAVAGVVALSPLAVLLVNFAANPSSNPFDADRGALSRYENTSKVCSSCGQDEGMAQFVAHSYNIDPKSILLGAGKIDWEILAGNIVRKQEVN